MRLKINVQHADACFAAEELRSENREAELGNLKQTRFEQYACMNPSVNVVSSRYLFRAKSRLLERGYDAVDIDNRDFKRHPEARAPKPITDRSVCYHYSFAIS